MHNESRPEAPLRVLVVGAGFAGLGLAIRLRQAGIDDYLVLEKAADVGGCWRENRYPGAACDVPSHLYSFSFEPKADWSRKFAPQAEILDYLRHCADKYRLREKIRFHCEVEEARFDAGSGEWQVRCADGQTLRARALVCATGQLSRPLLPRLPGLERFQGPAFHSANWDAEVELAGKRVAVIGTGASAIQFVPRIAPQVQRPRRRPGRCFPAGPGSFRRGSADGSRGPARRARHCRARHGRRGSRRGSGRVRNRPWRAPGQGWKGAACSTSTISGRSAGAPRSSSRRCSRSRARSAAQPKPRAMARKSGV